MRFFRNPAWVGSLNQPVTSAEPGPEPDPPTEWTLVSEFDLSDGTVGAAYSSPNVNVSSNGDYNLPGRVVQNWGGRTGKSIRFGRSSEVSGSENSRYRAWLAPNDTYLTANNMLPEGRVVYDIWLPPSPGFWQMPTLDPEVWWIGGLIASSRQIFYGFSLNTQTFGLWNEDASDFMSRPPNASLDLGGTPTSEWTTIDFRWRLAASGGYAYVKLGSFAAVEITGEDTSHSTGPNLFSMSPGNYPGSDNDLSLFGHLGTVRYYRPV